MRVLYTFPVYHCGWELDTVGKVCEDEAGERFLILSDHGREYIADLSEAVACIDRYLEAAKATTRAIAILRREEGSEEFISK